MLEAQPSDLAEVRSRRLCARVLELPEILAARTLMVYAPLKHEADVTPLITEWDRVVQLCGAATKVSLGAAPAGLQLPSPPPAHCEAEAARLAACPQPRICVPALNFTTRELWPAHVINWSNDLVLNRLGLREPLPSAPRVPINELDAVIVPALAFDLDRNRLGRGGGFYDRFLASLPPHIPTIGVAFDSQILEAVPTDKHDQLVSMVVTDERTIRG